MFLLLIIVVGLGVLFYSMYKSSQKNKNLKSKYKAIINEEIADDSLSVEEKLTRFYDSLTSPRDKSVIIDFAASAGIDLDNPRPKTTESLISVNNVAASYAEATAAGDVLIDSDQYENIDVQEPAEPEKVIDSANYLLFAGAALVVVALLFFANAASATFGSGVRFFALTLSSLVVYSAGLWVYKAKDILKPVGSTFIWIAILSVPAIGFSLYKDVLGSDLASLAWFITSLIAVFYVLIAYKVLDTNNYLEYLTYAASLNMLLSVVSVINTNIKIYALAGIVYALALLVLNSKGIIGKDKPLPFQVSVIVSALSTVIFGLNSLMNFSIDEALWLGAYAIALSLYIVALARLYKESLGESATSIAYALGGFIFPWGLSLIFSGLANDFNAYVSVLPIAIFAITIAGFLAYKKLSEPTYKSWLVVSASLALSSLMASPNGYVSAVIIGVYSLIILFVSISKIGKVAPFIALYGLPLALMIANDSSRTLDSVPALALSAGSTYLVAVVLVFLKTKNAKTIAVVGSTLWFVSSFALLVNGSFEELGLMLGAGALTLIIWQRQFFPTPLVSIALPISLLAPVVGFADSKNKLPAYIIGLFIFLGWAVAAKFFRVLFRQVWFTSLTVVSAVFSLLAILNLETKQATFVLASMVLINALFTYMGRSLLEKYRIMLSALTVYTAIAMVMVATNLNSFLSNNAYLVTLVACMVIYLVSALWTYAVHSKLKTNSRLSTYVRIATLAAIVIASFTPLVAFGEINNNEVFGIVAIVATALLALEGFISKDAHLRYGGSAVVLAATWQALWLFGINNIHVYTHVTAVYLLGLAYVVYTYRERKDIADNLILGAILLVLVVLSLNAIGGSTPASLAVLIESSLVALIAGAFKHKPALIASLSVLVLSILYRASGFLASIPTWVWYLLVGGGLIAAAAYILSKNNKQ